MARDTRDTIAIPSFHDNGLVPSYPDVEPGMAAVFDTPNGNRLQVHAGVTELEVFDPASRIRDGWAYGFLAETVREPDGSYAMDFTVRNRYPDGMSPRHPDIQPRLLLATALRYFDVIGKPVGHIDTAWHDVQGADTNFRAYYAALDGDYPLTPALAAEAARTTPSGRMVASLGYSAIHGEVAHVTLAGRESVLIRWAKPQTGA